jgi:hypothetical protein
MQHSLRLTFFVLLTLLLPSTRGVGQTVIEWKENGASRPFGITNGQRMKLTSGVVYEVSFQNLPLGTFMGDKRAEFFLTVGATNGTPATSILVEMLDPQRSTPFHTHTFLLDAAGWAFKDATRTVSVGAAHSWWMHAPDEVWQANAGVLRFTVSGGDLTLRRLTLRPRTETATYEVNFTGLPTTNTYLSLERTGGLGGSWQSVPLNSTMITAQGELNMGALTNSNQFYRLKIRTTVE